VDTLDRNNNPRWHSQAILQMSNNPYLMATSKRRNCSYDKPCRVLNCPFSQYGSESNERLCLTMKDLKSDKTYIDKDLVDDRTHKVNIQRSLSLTMIESNGEQTGFESLNYIGMLYPRMNKAILYDPRLARETLPCTDITIESEVDEGQRCYHNLVAQYGDIIEFLVVNSDSDQHPMHLHGSYFHIVEQGLAILNKTTGLITANNPNVSCDEHDINCKCVHCSSNTQLVKDTIIVPSGG
jgi:FtsP/CotA-like multicopper oxidase with cupredoxin domain